MAGRINLVPPAERARTTTNVGMLGLVAGIVVVLFGLGFGYYLLTNSRADWQEQLERAKQETVTVKGQIASLIQYEQLATDRKKAEELATTLYAGRTLVADFLDSFARVVPENVWLSSLSLTAADPMTTVDAAGNATTTPGGNMVTIEGQTYSFEDVAQVLVRLQLLPMLSEIDLSTASSQDDATAIKQFSIDAVLDKPDGTGIQLPLSQVEVEGL
jgi:Tfp pilus assembly protein PilN